MAIILGTGGGDLMFVGSVSPGVTGGVPSNADDSIEGFGGNDTIDGGLGSNVLSGGTILQAADSFLRIDMTHVARR